MNAANILRRIVSGLVTTALAASPALVLAADEVDQTNKDTGPGSTNRNRAAVRRDIRDIRTQHAHVRNSAHVHANTGGNSSDGNTTGGTVDSGNITVDSIVDNDVNQSSDGVPPVDPVEADVDQTNDTTGPHSTNTNRARIRSSYETRLRKDAHVRNSFDVHANTGHNSSDGNTTGGNVDSGNVSVTVDFFNTVN